MPTPKPDVSVIVTRPMPAAKTWQQDLAQRLPNVHVHSMPLIDITTLKDSASIEHLHQLLHQPAQLHAMAFVSRFAVIHFFTHTKITGAQFNRMHVRAWAVGQGTREALLQAGVLPEWIDSPPADASQFDSNILWKQVATQLDAPQAQGKSILLVRGIDDAAIQPKAPQKNQLEQILQANQIAHTGVFVYARKLPVWNTKQQDFVMQLLQKNSVWLFSSSMSVLHLAHLMPQVNAAQWRAQQAIATHARIAQAAATLGFSKIELCRPVLDDVAQSILYLCKAKLRP